MAKAERPIDKVMTMYEHIDSFNPAQMVEDDEWRYIYVPADMEDRIVRYLRNGYQPAPDHKLNDMNQVVLRMDKKEWAEKYRRNVERRKALIKDKTSIPDAYLDTANESNPRQLGELIAGLPDLEPEPVED